VFEELFKLIFTKLYDEMESGRDRKRYLVFKNYGDTETELKAKIQGLFDKARAKWEGVFPEGDKIQLTPSHLALCVSSLEKVKLCNSNLEVVDEAFEYLINKSSKGEKGQYFTPRYVIDMCVRMLNPQPEETLIDTAAGSCGFPMHAIFHVWEQIMKEGGGFNGLITLVARAFVQCRQARAPLAERSRSQRRQAGGRFASTPLSERRAGWTDPRGWGDPSFRPTSMKEEGLGKSHPSTTEKKPPRCEDYVRDKVFAIDFDERELLNLPVPRALIEHANDYVAAVQSMIDARQRAKQLLDAAKRAVEIAIESSESDALAFLDQTLAEAGEANP